MNRLLQAAPLLLLAACGRKPDFAPVDSSFFAAAPKSKTPAAVSLGYTLKAGEIDAHTGAVTDLAFLDWARFVTVSYDDQRVAVWTVADGALISEAKHNRRLLAVAALPDGSGILTADAYGFLVFWPFGPSGLGASQTLNPETGTSAVDTIENRLGHHPRLAISPNGLLLAASSYDQRVTIWDVRTRKELVRLATGRKMRAVAFSPDSRRIAVGGVDNTYTLWDLSTGVGRTVEIPKVSETSDVSGIAFSSDGTRLATGHMDSSLTLWDADGGKERGNWFVQSSSVFDVAFSPDSALLAASGYGGIVTLWDAKTAAAKGSLQGLEGSATCVAFSPDGAVLAAGGEKGRVLLFR